MASTTTAPDTTTERHPDVEESQAVVRPTRPGRDLGFGAYVLLRLGFGIAPILFGIDKFFDFMVEWPAYLWADVEAELVFSAVEIMYVVGALEILAGLLVLFAPRIGGPLVTIWLAAIVANLVFVSALADPVESLGRSTYWDIALRDVGLMIGAGAFSLLAFQYAGRRRRSRSTTETGRRRRSRSS